MRLQPPANSDGAPPPVKLPLDEAPPEAREPSGEPVKEWYGWQTLASDGTSFGLMALVGVDNGGGGGALALVGLAGFVLVPPIIHAVHGNRWGWASAALRMGAVLLVFAGVIEALGNIDCEEHCTDGTASGVLFVGGLAAALTAVISDAALARSVPERSSGPSFGMWGDPRTASAGFSLTVVE